VQAARAQVHRDTMGGDNGGLVALRHAKKDGDGPFYGRAQGGGSADLHTKAKGGAVQIAAWAVGRPRRAWAPSRVRRRGHRSGGAAGTRGKRGQGVTPQVFNYRH
jgi:hypothetical protein